MTVRSGGRAGVVLCVAVAAACVERPPTTPTPTADVVGYYALGASDTLGIGSSQPCLPLSPCPQGLGYVQVLARRLESGGVAVTLTNLGIPGAVLSPEIEAIGNSLGRGIPLNMLERTAPFVGADATVVTLFTGGNDANTIGAAANAGLGGADPTAYVNGLVERFGADLVALVDTVRSRAPAARIVVLNLPNLAAMPYMSGATPAERRGLQQIAVGLSGRINQLAARGVEIVDLMCDPAVYLAGFTSSDGFHPSDGGYAHLADRLFPVVNGSPAGAPPAACAQMAIF